MALFQKPTANSRAPATNYLAEINCGRMVMNETTKMVEPQLEKGLLYVKQMDDTLIHLVWKERGVANSKIPEDDLIVFEGDCSVRLIKQLPDHRVFLVRWNQTNTRKIYWMQHTDKTKDEELVKDLDTALNNTTEAQKKQREKNKSSSKKDGSEKAAAGGLDLASLMGGEAGSSEILNQLMQSGALDQNTMTSLLQQMGGANMGGSSEEKSETAAAAETPKSSKPSKKAKLGAADLQNAFGMVSQKSSKKTYDLTKVLGSESLVDMLSNKEVQERLNTHMPKDEKIKETKEELRAAVGSPQYQQAVQAFQEALESGQLAPVLQQFNLPESAISAAKTGDVKAFAEAMESSSKKDDDKTKNVSELKTPVAEKKEAAKKEKGGDDDDEDDKMAVD